MIELWDFAARAVRESGRAVLVVVVDRVGSVPGGIGTSMVVSPDGCAGTVGGGIAEHEAIERAHGLEAGSELFEVEHTAAASGSLCSGRQTLAMVALGRDLLPALEGVAATLERDGFGSLEITEHGLTFAPGQRTPTSFATTDGGWRFDATLGDLDTLYVFGGGHVALALSRVMATLPFRIVVLDDRADLPTLAANRWAAERRVIDYRSSESEVVPGERSWAVIMTHGHAADELVLSRLVEMDLRYLGLLGSAAKVKQLFAHLREQGVPDERLGRVRAPVGLDISSHTPEEIAISIAAEIIRERNAR